MAAALLISTMAMDLFFGINLNTQSDSYNDLAATKMILDEILCGKRGKHSTFHQNSITACSYFSHYPKQMQSEFIDIERDYPEYQKNIDGNHRDQNKVSFVLHVFNF